MKLSKNGKKAEVFYAVQKNISLLENFVMESSYTMQFLSTEEVDYKISLMNKTAESELIQFMTDGILLMEIQSNRLLNKYFPFFLIFASEGSLSSVVF